MGLCLKNNKGEKIQLSYSSFNRMRYMLLSYVCNEDFEKVKKIDYFSNFLIKNKDEKYLFKFFIEHSDSEGRWNKEEIEKLVEEFSLYYNEVVKHQQKLDNFDMKYDGDMNFKPLIELLEKSVTSEILF